MKGNILLIDDNMMDLKVASLSIEKQGFACHSFTDYSKALDWTSSQDVQMIFLDLQMPQISGYDLISIFRKQPQTCLVPIIIISGKNQIDDVRKAIALGANDYIVKPLDPLIIQEKLRRAEPNEKEDYFCVELNKESSKAGGYFSKSFKINSVSEFGVRIISDSPVMPGESIEATQVAKEIFGTDKLYLRCLSCEPLPEDRLYQMQMTYIGTTEVQRQFLRKSCRQLWIDSKAKKEAA